MKKYLSLGVIFFLLNSFVLHASEALTDAEKNEIRRAQLQLASDVISTVNYDDVNDALQALDKDRYKFKEVSAAVIAFIEREVPRDKPNFVILKKAILVAQRLADREDAQRFSAAHDNFKKLDAAKIGTETKAHKEVLDAFSTAQSVISKATINPTLKSKNPGDEELDELDQIYNELLDTVENEINIPINAAAKPSDIDALIKRTQATLRKLESLKPPLRPGKARDIAIEAFKILFSGRGETRRGLKDGWSLNNRSGLTGENEIIALINSGLIDQSGKDELLQFLKDYNVSDPDRRTASGFPPTWEVVTEAQKTKINGLVEKLKPAADFVEIERDISGLKTLEELLEANIKKIKAKDQKSLRASIEAELKEKLGVSDFSDVRKFITKALLSNLSANFYNKSVRQMRADKPLPDYFGRERESRLAGNVFTKLEKSHLLLTGKAGVGKTTILRIIQDRMLLANKGVRAEPPAIILELPITAVTNPSDPSAIMNIVKAAEALSLLADRRVILFVDEAHVSSDMTRQALKGFLTNLIKPVSDDSRVHFAWATTSSEARDFLSDSAFCRRWTPIDVPEFSKEDTLKLVKQTALPLWKRYHKTDKLSFEGITDDAFEVAYRYAELEQPHAGNPTGVKEILEAAIVDKLNRESANATTPTKFVLDVPDIQRYLREAKGMDLVPGDPDFMRRFDEKWTGLEEEYVGNDGYKYELKKILTTHFGQLHRNKMTALVQFGPPGGGKSFSAEVIARHFFKGAKLPISAAEIDEGGPGRNKLLGSVAGYEGSKEQLGLLPKFFAENPQGGVIVIEEADYLPQEIIQLFTNMITDKQLIDGRGKTWKTDKFVIILNSNVGQEAMISSDTDNRMNWEQYDTRRQQLTQRFSATAGKIIDKVRQDALDRMMDQFVGKIVTSPTRGRDNVDTSLVAQEAQKQKRRYNAMYILPPTREELMSAAQSRLKKYVKTLSLEYGIKLEVSDEDLRRIIDLERYDFTKGHSYVVDNLEKKLFEFITPHLHERGKAIKAEVEDYSIELEDYTLPAQRVVLTVGDEKIVHEIGTVANLERNPWGENDAMMDRIKKFPSLSRKYMKGNEKLLESAQQLLKQKANDWNTRVVYTLLGTSGNGKTRFAHTLAMVLYDDPKAVFEITGISHEYQLNNIFGSPKGFVGMNEATDFEKWVDARKSAGGGVILLDELLSLSDMNPTDLSNRRQVYQKLYDLLDKGIVTIRGKVRDVRGFPVVITGNALQEMFNGIGDDPDSERIVKEILKRMKRDEIVKYFESKMFDAPAIARMGQIHVLGPQPKDVNREVGDMHLNALLEKLNANRPQKKKVQIKISPEIVDAVIDNMTTVKLGMREVNRGFDVLIFQPLNGILVDIKDAKDIEAKMEDGKVVWYVNEKKVAPEAIKVDPKSELVQANWNYVDRFAEGAQDRTPQVKDMGAPEKLKTSDETFFGTLVHEWYGHLMVEVLLKRKNSRGAVSLIAGQGYLGYVRNKFEEIYHDPSLTDMIKEAIMLNAGHRSDFYFDMYHLGGGHRGKTRDPKDKPRDDLGKLDILLEQMINNGLIPNLHETSHPALKAQFKQFMRDFIDQATDEVIRRGVESEQFDPGAETILKKKFLGEAELDGIVAGIDFSSFGSEAEFFLNTVSSNMSKTWKTWEEKNQKRPEKVQSIKEIIPELLVRIFGETKTKNIHDDAELKKIDDLRADAGRTLGFELRDSTANCSAKMKTLMKLGLRPQAPKK